MVPAAVENKGRTRAPRCREVLVGAVARVQQAGALECRVWGVGSDGWAGSGYCPTKDGVVLWWDEGRDVVPWNNDGGSRRGGGAGSGPSLSFSPSSLPPFLEAGPLQGALPSFNFPHLPDSGTHTKCLHAKLCPARDAGSAARCGSGSCVCSAKALQSPAKKEKQPSPLSWLCLQGSRHPLQVALVHSRLPQQVTGRRIQEGLVSA